MSVPYSRLMTELRYGRIYVCICLIDNERLLWESARLWGDYVVKEKHKLPNSLSKALKKKKKENSQRKGRKGRARRDWSGPEWRSTIQKGKAR